MGPLGKSIFESLPAGVVAFDRDLRIIEANGQAASLIDLAERIDESLAKGTSDKIWRGWTEQLKASLSEGETYRFEDVSYTMGGRPRLLEIICTPLRDAERQEVFGGTVVIEDMTEKAAIQKQLADSERLAAVGRLASRVAHELNNPMDGILRYINLAIRMVEQEKLDKPREYLLQSRQGLMRMVQIVSELLEFSRNTHASFECTRIEQIIEDAVKTMEARAEALRIRISRDYSRNIPALRSGNLFQVFCNLAKNAIDAMPDGGELQISTRLEGNSVAVVEFRDTGVGFAPEHKEEIFQPFFTTKERGKGTGLGLAICRDIVEGYHGRITAENRPEGGSIFTVYLPLSR